MSGPVAAAYRQSLEAGERVSLALREAAFEQGRDIGDPATLAELAGDAGVADPSAATDDDVLAEWREGQERGVIGSPHFFAGGEGWFCPALEIIRVGDELRVARDPQAFERFFAACFAP